MSDNDNQSLTGFARFQFNDLLQKGIDACGFTSPRPIQERTISAALEGRDVLGLAQTGTGKTAAFALPVLQNILKHKAKGPRVLVVAPTRELAKQIEDEIQRLAQFTRIKTATVYGGMPMQRQVIALRSYPEIVVACPGRLLDLMNRGAVSLAHIETLILDEADHMFDMGFLPDVRRIIAACPAERQNLLFSATMPSEVRKLADKILQDPEVVELSHSQPAETIEHALYPVQEQRKLDLLKHLIGKDDFKSAIVFTRTKHRAKKMALQLSKSDYRAIALQGNMSQGQRDRAMNGFRRGHFDILVATDIAARGIDVADISHVINFDIPNTPEAYTHRIGRTGRSEKQGKAFTFVTGEDRRGVNAIEKLIGAEIPRCKVEGFEAVAWSPSKGGASDEQPGQRQNRRNNTGRRPSGGGGYRGRSSSSDNRQGGSR
jgi:ATP-dependent RNA helicase RhlE